MVASASVMGNLVDIERGLISRDVFVNQDIYQQELEQVFARAWLLVGHESQIPNPNDFYISRMGEESVILTRDRQDKIHVLLNTCRHRGMKVCRYDEGNTPVFSCPYHGWSYSTDGNLVSVPGELIGVPQFATAYHGELEKEQWGLISVPKMHIYKGLIWACWDKDAPDWDDYMGDMRICLDDMLDSRDGREGGAEFIPGVQKWILPSNYKFATENFIGDGYHGISHRSEILIGTGPGGPGSERHAMDANRPSGGSISFPKLGHGTLGSPLHQDYDWFPVFEAPNHPSENTRVIAEYFEEVKRKRRERIGDKRIISSGVGSVFPNMSYHSRFPRTIALWHPNGPQSTEGWRLTVVDKDAPDEVKDMLRRYSLRYSGPGGLTEEDDMENWNYASEASSGTIALRRQYNYQLNLNRAVPADGLKDAVFTPGTGEQNQRHYYHRWAEFMDAKSWDDLYPVKRT